MKTKIILFCLIAIFIPLNYLFALTLVMKSDKIVRGELLELTDKNIKLNVNGEEVTYDRSDIGMYLSKEPPELREMEEFENKFKKCEPGAKIKLEEYGGIIFNLFEIIGPKENKCLVKTESIDVRSPKFSEANICEYETKYDSFQEAVINQDKEACQQSTPSTLTFYPVISLKSGEIVKGEWVGSSENSITLNVKGKEVTYNQDEINYKEEIPDIAFGGKHAEFLEFEDKFKKCEPGAIFNFDVLLISIIGPKNGKCMVTLEIVGSPKGPEDFKSKTCEYEISKYKSLTEALDDKSVCHDILAE